VINLVILIHSGVLKEVATIKRADLINKAKELIASQPKAGRREIAADLRREHGVALRDSVILALQREAYPERGRIIVATYQFAKPMEERYRPRRQGRYNKLVKLNFNADEARKLSILPLTRLTFIKDAAAARKMLIAGLKKEAEFAGWSKTRYDKELKELLDYTYKDSGWADLNDINNPYSMLRYFRRAAIEAGTWDPKDSPWRKKPSIRQKMYSSRWKGDTIGQHKRWRTLHKEEIREAKQTYRQRQREKKAKAS